MQCFAFYLALDYHYYSAGSAKGRYGFYYRFPDGFYGTHRLPEQPAEYEGECMALIDWDDSFSVHVKEIDGEHRKIVEMINELHDAMHRKRGKEALTGILHGLIDYAATHFKTEEKYFAEFGYPDAKMHESEHAEFAGKIAEFRKAFDAGKLGLSIDVMDYLDGWITNHIKVVDKKYSQFFNAKGLV